VIGLLISLAIQAVALMISLTILLIRVSIRLAIVLAAAIAGLVSERRRGSRAGAHMRRRMDPQLRWSVFRRDHYACVHCGSTADLTVDHIHPVSLGGADSPENLQTLCRTCNSSKGVT
jgi:hypothetical protein